jgi:predicted transcriptional regulator
MRKREYKEKFEVVGGKEEILKNMKNRSEIEVMASILDAATTNWEYKTTIMNNAAVSHSQLIRYLAIAVERGLMEYSEVRDLYKTTEAGLLFLDKYAHLLRLLPKIPVSPNLIRYEEEKGEVREGAEEERGEDSVVSEQIRK